MDPRHNRWQKFRIVSGQLGSRIVASGNIQQWKPSIFRLINSANLVSFFH